MSTDTNTPPSTSTGEQGAQGAQGAAAEPERVYVQIPKAGPGQGYRAQKNVPNPLLDLIWRVTVVVLAATLPFSTGLIFFMILAKSNAINEGLLWLWGFMVFFIEAIAIPVAIGVIREALGYSGIRHTR